MSDRAILFIDGSNWYHGLGRIGVRARSRLDYRKISEKLVGPREWLGTRYYIGQVVQEGNTALYAQQRTFLAALAEADARISIHLGRIEPRRFENKAAKELRHYLATLPSKIDERVYADLSAIAHRHMEAEAFVEKAVDVFLAVDVVTMAMDDSFDAAYLLTADGDFTPAVNAARALGKKVYAASAIRGFQLSNAVNASIQLPREWFDDCFLPRAG
jgi:uncharacterized LabA/DUF88 family protein